MAGIRNSIEEMLTQAHGIDETIDKPGVIPLPVDYRKMALNSENELIQRAHDLREFLVILFNSLNQSLINIRHSAAHP